MDAESREAVFRSLREQGIKAIKVVAADGSKANGEIRGVRKRVVFTAIFAAVIVTATCVYFLTKESVSHLPDGTPASSTTSPAQDTRNKTQSAHRPARPLERQVITGDRRRIEDAVNSLTNATERLLAVFVEPGRPLPKSIAPNPTDAEFAAILAKPVLVAADEYTEAIDVKRILEGIKKEMSAYMAAGGTADAYIAELVKRQKLEISYRERAERHLNTMLNARAGIDSTAEQALLKNAYEYWLKSNAQLQALGIYPLTIPDRLRSYQLSLDIDD